MPDSQTNHVYKRDSYGKPMVKTGTTLRNTKMEISDTQFYNHFAAHDVKQLDFGFPHMLVPIVLYLFCHLFHSM
jgi:hypothetical protein